MQALLHIFWETLNCKIQPQHHAAQWQPRVQVKQWNFFEPRNLPL
jgi:hypothetical protein